MKVENLKDLAVKSLIEYGDYANTTRGTISYMDGLKTVHRRVLYAATKICKDKLVKTAELIGYVISNLHPHGDIPVFSSITTLVHNGFLIGKGNWGSKLSLGKSSPAAYRYTSVKLSPIIEKLGVIDLLDTSINIVNDLDKLEPLYLPTPVPIMMIKACDYPSPMLGIGLVIRSKYPVFDLKSILDVLPKLSEIYSIYTKEKEKSSTVNDSKKLNEIKRKLMDYCHNLKITGYKGTKALYDIENVMFNNKFTIAYVIDITHNGKDEIYINSPINNIRGINSLADMQDLIEDKIFRNLVSKYNISQSILNFNLIEEERKDNYRIIIKFKSKDILKINKKSKNKYGITESIIDELITNLSNLFTYSDTYDIKSVQYKLSVGNNVILDTSDLGSALSYKDIKKYADKILELKSLDSTLINVDGYIVNTNILDMFIQTYNIFKISHYIKIISIIHKLEEKISELNLLKEIKDILINYGKNIKTKEDYNKFITHVVKEINRSDITKKVVESVMKKYSINQLLKSEFDSKPFVKEMEMYKNIIKDSKSFNKYINNKIKEIMDNI